MLSIVSPSGITFPAISMLLIEIDCAKMFYLRDINFCFYFPSRSLLLENHRMI